MAPLWATAFLGGALIATPTPLRFVAEVDDVYSLTTNPGGLGWLQGGELRLLYARDGLDPGPGELGGRNGFAAFAGGRLSRAFAVAGALDIEVDGQDRTNFQTSLGMGLGERGVGWGLSWDHLGPADAPAKNRLNSGLGIRWAEWVATAVAVRDLTQTVGPRTWDLGAAVRPFDRWVISGVWRLTQGVAAGPDLGVRMSVEPFDGIIIGAGLDRTDGEALRGSAQLAIRLGGLSIGSAVVGLGDDPGVIGELGLLGDHEPSLISSRVVPVLSLSGSLVAPPDVSLFPPGLQRGVYSDVPLVIGELGLVPEVQGVLVKIGRLDIGWGKAAEIRRGLLDLGRRGRKVYCVLSEASDIEVFVASGCGRTLLLTPALWSANGLSAEAVYLGEGLERLGITVQVVREGVYKTTPDRFTRKSMSPEEREALGAYLDDIYGALVRALSQSRGLSEEQVRSLLDDGVKTASAAQAARLVDEVLYPDQLEERLEQTFGSRVDFVPAFSVVKREQSRWTGRPRIAIIHIDAAIASGESVDLPLGFGQTSGASSILEALDRVGRDRTFVAAVLRVDSPGGDALASDLIARAVAKLDKNKPVIASFGDIAASGGYYVAAPARAIFAEDTTLTGSIGVFFANASFERLMERIGLYTSAETRGRVARSGSAFADWTEAEREQATRVVEHYYRLFLETVEQGRHLDADHVRAAAAGRIWSGKAARDLGLVDGVGGLTDAVRRAKEEAGLASNDPIELVTLPDSRKGLTEVVRYIADGESPPAASLVPLSVRRMVRHWGAAFLGPGPRPVALSPVLLDID